MSDRWIALHCSEDASALIENHPSAFLLLTQIASRAKWKDCAITRLKKGQAYVGDWRKSGIRSEMAYRHAKKTLEKCKFATFQGTNKGTVATILNSSIYSISNEANNEPRNSPATGKEQAGNGQGTTNHTDTQNTEHTDTKKKRAATAVPMPDLPFSSAEFTAAWGDWLSHKKEVRQPMPSTTIKSQFAQFAKWGEEKAIQSIRKSIQSNWTGLFEPKKESPAQAGFTPAQSSRHTPEHLAYCKRFNLDPDSADANLKLPEIKF